MATITFTATEADGTEHTRTSGTMPYVAISVGSQVIWHKSFAAAYKAASSRQQTWRTGKVAEVIPAYPTKINGKIDADTFAEGWGDIPASAFEALVAEKLGTAAPVAEVVAEALEIDAEAEAIVAAEQPAEEAPATEVRYLASRDSRGARTDEDAAMAHARIYAGSDLAEAQAALHAYMVKEADWLAEPRYRSATSLRRAADILEAAEQARTLTPEEGKPWSKAEVVSQTGDTVALVWSIVRIER